MRNVLINGYGNPIHSKIKNEKKSRDLIFLWKNNIFNVNSQILKQELKNYKSSSLKSSSFKKSYLIWKKTIYKFKKLKLFHEKQIKILLIKKGYLEPSIKDKALVEKVNHENELSILLTKVTNKYESIFQKQHLQLIENKFGNNALHFQEISKNLKLFSNEMIILKNKVQKMKNVFQDGQKNFFEKEKKIKRQFNIEKIKFIFQSLKNLNKSRHFLLNQKIAYLTFKLEFLEKFKSISYDLEYEYLSAEIAKKYLSKILKNKDSFIVQNYEFQSDLKINLVDNSQKYRLELKKLKSKYEKEKSQLKIFLKSRSASKLSKRIEFKKIRNNFVIQRRQLKLNVNKRFKLKNDWSIFKTNYYHQRRIWRKSYLSEKNDLLQSTPIEITNKKYWILNILGVLIPGSSAFIKKQYFKGMMLFIGTIISGLILALSFGGFPSSYGNGILGLKTLGWDPETQDVGRSIIGLTNNVPNDARFFLVTGVVSICLFVISICFFIIQGLNNINVNNLAKIGVRHTQFSQQKKLLKGQGLPFLISAPAFIFIIFIIIIPVIATLLISFTNLNQNDFYDSDLKVWRKSDGVSWPVKWVGIKQYEYIFKVIGPEFGRVLLWTLVWTFGSTFLALFLGVFLAVIANQSRIRGKTFIRVIYLLPWSVPAFITIMFFSIFFQPSGTFNKVLGNAIFSPDREWLNDGGNTKMLMILLQGWLGFSYIFLLITSLLQSIPKSLYEAARVDGASSWKQLTGITIPIILEKIAPLLIGQFTFAFNNFGLIYLLNNGGVTQSGSTAGEFDIFISWVYKLITSTNNPRPGASAAISLVISIFTITPSAILFIKSKSFRGGDF